MAPKKGSAGTVEDKGQVLSEKFEPEARYRVTFGNNGTRDFLGKNLAVEKFFEVDAVKKVERLP